jgi:prepilin-type processing-associated H-X9-DG protein
MSQSPLPLVALSAVRPCGRSRLALTLAELLVVLAILAVVLGFLVPAILQVRELSNRARCANNLKHIGMAMLAHHTMKHRFPSGGWGWLWVGDPDRPSAQAQPGGWMYNVLPYVDQGQLYALGTGATCAQKHAAAAQVIQTPLAVAICPTRRAVIPYPNTPTYHNAAPVHAAARSDYAACAGDQLHVENGTGPTCLAQGDNPAFWTKPDYSVDDFTGVIFQRSAITLADLTRGASHTYLVGEKYLNPDHYTDGLDGADNENMYCGMDNDTSRCTAAPPLRDQPGYSDGYVFGSPHPNGVNMLFGDGSYRLVSYAVDPEVHRQAGSRK